MSASSDLCPRCAQLQRNDLHCDDGDVLQKSYASTGTPSTVRVRNTGCLDGAERGRVTGQALLL